MNHPPKIKPCPLCGNPGSYLEDKRRVCPICQCSAPYGEWDHCTRPTDRFIQTLAMDPHPNPNHPQNS